jgi:protein-S-isoprenylcysteine O-methyltransferase Ste14
LVGLWAEASVWARRHRPATLVLPGAETSCPPLVEQARQPMPISDSMLSFRPSPWNAWLLFLPLLGVGVYTSAARKDVARRLADMTGYRADEKFFTVAASVAPYPLMLVSVGTPFTQVDAALVSGLGFYLLGLVGFLGALRAFVRNPPAELCAEGVYRWSRNPLYLSATCMFFGVALATLNLVLFGILVVMLPLQHRMIQAEERACRQKHGDRFLEYAARVPRYLARF